MIDKLIPIVAESLGVTREEAERILNQRIAGWPGVNAPSAEHLIEDILKDPNLDSSNPDDTRKGGGTRSKGCGLKGEDVHGISSPGGTRGGGCGSPNRD